MKKEEFKLMLVEDSEADILLTKKAIENGHYSVELEIFRDGMSALEFLGDEKNVDLLPDLIILDINMPGLNGFEVLKEIKDTFRLKHLSVIMFSTSDTNDDLLMAYRLGASSFVKKPIDFAEFKELMDALQRFWFGQAKLPVVCSQSKFSNFSERA